MYVKNSFWSKQRSHWQCWQGCFGQCYHKHYRAEHAIDFLVNWWSVWRQSNQCKICEIGVASYLLARMVGGLARGGFINVVTELFYVVSGGGGFVVVLVLGLVMVDCAWWSILLVSTKTLLPSCCSSASVVSRTASVIWLA